LNQHRLRLAPRQLGGFGRIDLELALGGDGPLTRQVFAALKMRIESGDLPAGTRLPGTRQLALELGVARGTVVGAYQQLEAEGYCLTRPRSGTRVAELPVRSPGDALPGAERATARPRQPLRWHLDGHSFELDLRPGAGRAADFPHELWARLARRELQRGALERFSYPDPEGLPRLRVAVAEHLRKRRGLFCSASQVMITQGAQQAFSLIARALLPVGLPVAVEDPGYRGFSQAAQAAGIDIAPVPVDEQGLVVEAVPGNVSSVCVTPAHQFPTGVILSAPRRHALLAWSEAHHAWLIEDDYDGDIRLDAPPLVPLKHLDRTGRVLLVGSFSSTVFPDLRLGYMVADPEHLQLLALMKNLDDAGSSTLNQSILAAFMEDGHFQRHLRRSVRAITVRRGALIEALERQFGDAVRITGAPAGLHLVADLGLDPEQERAVVQLARHRGLGLQTLSEHARARGAPSGFVMSYGRLDAERLEAAVGRLARAVADLSQRRPGLRRR
jgi:GntR family transcriptional regulator / MocR family aminotransferase